MRRPSDAANSDDSSGGFPKNRRAGARLALTFAGAALAASAATSGCAHGRSQAEVSREVEAGVARQSPAPLHGPVAAKGMKAILESPSLSPEQKKKFVELHVAVMKETFAVQNEISRHKALLFETISSTPVEGARVEEIKNRLVSLNERRMKAMFSALESAQSILGFMTPEERKQMGRDLIDAHDRFPF